MKYRQGPIKVYKGVLCWSLADQEERDDAESEHFTVTGGWRSDGRSDKLFAEGITKFQKPGGQSLGQGEKCWWEDVHAQMPVQPGTDSRSRGSVYYHHTILESVLMLVLSGSFY